MFEVSERTLSEVRVVSYNARLGDVGVGVGGEVTVDSFDT